MLELLQGIVDWIKNSGFAEIASIGGLGTTIGVLVSLGSKLKKITIKEIETSAKQIQVSREFKETSNEIVEIQNNQRVITETLNRLSALLVVVLNNSKISAEAKQQALNIMNAVGETSGKVVEKVKKVSEIVEEVITKVEEDVRNENENQVETNPYLSNLENLINEN